MCNRPSALPARGAVSLWSGAAVPTAPGYPRAMNRASLLSLAIVGLSACEPAPAPPPIEASDAPVVRDVSGEALGTTWHVKWVEPAAAGDSSEQVRAATDAALAEVDLHMSTWRDDSELNRARRADGPLGISDDTAQVVSAALGLSAATNGAFDPTVQPLMELWGLHGNARDAVPTDDEIASTLERVGWRRVRLGRAEDGQAVLDVGGTALDLSAIAKGHAVDRVHNALSGLGIGSVFVEVGGEVRVSGPGASGPLWRVGVDLPDPSSRPGQDLALVVELTNGSVATSGNYRNRYEVDGQTVVHTMDPRLGRPTETAVASATVRAPDCRTADGLATALMVLPPDEGLALIERRPDVEAAVLLFEGDGFALRASSGATQAISVVSERVHP